MGRGMPETPCVCPSVSLLCSLGSLTYQSNMWGLTVRENQSCCLCAELQLHAQKESTHRGRQGSTARHQRAGEVCSLSPRTTLSRGACPCPTTCPLSTVGIWGVKPGPLSWALSDSLHNNIIDIAFCSHTSLGFLSVTLSFCVVDSPQSVLDWNVVRGAPAARRWRCCLPSHASHSLASTRPPVSSFGFVPGLPRMFILIELRQIFINFSYQNYHMLLLTLAAD